MKSPSERIDSAVEEAWESVDLTCQSFQFTSEEAVRYFQKIKALCGASIDGIEGGKEDGDR